jgi:uncharacterized membrane protein YkvA (DUF1232 family)
MGRGREVRTDPGSRRTHHHVSSNAGTERSQLLPTGSRGHLQRGSAPGATAGAGPNRGPIGNVHVTHLIDLHPNGRQADRASPPLWLDMVLDSIGMVRDLLITLGAFLVIWVIALAALVIAGRRTAARRLVKAVPDLLALLRGLRKDPRVPRRAKRWLLVALVWVLFPIDLVPEFIPIIGPLDDIVVVVLVLRHLLKTTPRHVIAEHWRGDPVVLEKTLRLAGRFRVQPGSRIPGQRELPG